MQGNVKIFSTPVKVTRMLNLDLKIDEKDFILPNVSLFYLKKYDKCGKAWKE